MKRILILSLCCLFCSSHLDVQGQGLILSDEDKLDLSLIPPTIDGSSLSYYDYDRLDYGMTIGIQNTLKGRIWACWVSGGDDENAFFVLASSDDRGETSSKPQFVIDPHNPELGEARRTIVGNLWLDPNGNLWLFFDQAMSYFDGRAGTWYSVCKNPDSDAPVWSDPIRIWHGCSLNKPIVLHDGTWLLPVSLWSTDKITKKYKDKYKELDIYRGANVIASVDQGKTWEKRGLVSYPNPDFDEHSFIELKDGRVWMSARTKNDIWESFSTDKGWTWSTPSKSKIMNINSRHYIRRLTSGNILLVKNGMSTDIRSKTRSELTAFISKDDGDTWLGGLVLDERRGVSYPDGFQDSDGMIYISYDRNRSTDGEILMAKFREEDVLSKEFKSKDSRGRIHIFKPKGLDRLPAPSEIRFQNYR